MIRGSMHAICSRNINKTKKFNYTSKRAIIEKSVWIYFFRFGGKGEKLFNITEFSREIRQMMGAGGKQANPFDKLSPKSITLSCECVWQDKTQLQISKFSRQRKEKVEIFLNIGSDALRNFSGGKVAEFKKGQLIRNIKTLFYALTRLRSSSVRGKFKFIASKRIYFLRTCNKRNFLLLNLLKFSLELQAENKLATREKRKLTEKIQSRFKNNQTNQNFFFKNRIRKHLIFSDFLHSKHQSTTG